MRIFSAFIITLGLIFGPAAYAQEMDMNDTVQEQAEVKEKTDNRNPYDLPPYSIGDTTVFGEIIRYTVGEEDTLHDIARHFKTGFVNLRAANQGVDAWTPVPGSTIIVPSLHILPRAPQKGIIINLAEMRLYYFKDEQGIPLTFPIGIGREGLETPVGQTTIVRKKDGPSWHPTARMKEEKPYLPDRVPPGPANPLGTHALYLGWPTFLIHGTNKPSGIGRRVSSGCIRMLPESITEVFKIVPVGTPVSVVDQPVKAAVADDTLYLEINPTGKDVGDIELTGTYNHPVPLEDLEIPDGLKKLITETIGDRDITVDWDEVKIAYFEKKAYPVAIGHVLAEAQTAEADVIVPSVFSPNSDRMAGNR